MKRPDIKIKTIILACMLGIVAVVTGIGVRLYIAWNPLGNALIDSAKKSAEDRAAYDLLETQGKFNVLVMGQDDVLGSSRSDTILFVSVDIDDKIIKVLSLPRDTRVVIPGHGTQKLNHAFAYGGQDLLRATVSNYLGEPILYYVIVDYDSFPAFVDILGGVEVDVARRMRYVDRAGGLYIDIKPGLQTLDGETALHFVRFRKDALGDIGRIQRQQQFLKAVLKKAYDPRIIVKLPELVTQAMKIFRTDMSPSFSVQLAGFLQNEVGRDNMFFATLNGTSAIIDGLSYWMGDLRDAKTFLEAPLEQLTGTSGETDSEEESSSDKETAASAQAAESNDTNNDKKNTKSDSKNINNEKRKTNKENKNINNDQKDTNKDNKSINNDNKKDTDKENKSKNKQAEAAKQPQMTAGELTAVVKSMTESIAVLNGTGKSGVATDISTRLQKIGIDVVHTGNAKHFDYRYSNIIYPTGSSASVKETAQTLGKLLMIPENLERANHQAFYTSLVAGHDYERIVMLLDDLVKLSDSSGGQAR